MPLRGVLLLGIVVASLPVCFLSPFFGVLMWTIVAFLNPHRFTWGAAEAFPWAQAVGGATVAGFVVFTRGWMRRLACPQMVVLAALWFWFVVTSVVSSQTPAFVHHAQDTWFRFEFVSKILLMTLITVGVVDSFHRLRILVLVLAGCFGVLVAKSLPFVLLTGGSFRVHGPEHSMIGDNNDFGLALNMTVPLFFFLAKTERNVWVRRLFAVLFVGSIPTIFFTYSRGAMLGLLAVLLLMFLQLKQRLPVVLIALLGITVAALFAPEAWKERMDPTRPGAVDASARSRFNAWTFSWNLALDYPVFGGGFETFTPQLFDRYAPTSIDVHGPHSIYFGVVAEHGFIGLLLYACLLGTTFSALHHAAKVAREYGDTVQLHYANAFRFSLVGFFGVGPIPRARIF